MIGVPELALKVLLKSDYVWCDSLWRDRVEEYKNAHNYNRLQSLKNFSNESVPNFIYVSQSVGINECKYIF